MLKLLTIWKSLLLYRKVDLFRFYLFIKFIISRTGHGERFLTLFLASSLKNSAIQKISILTNISSLGLWYISSPSCLICVTLRYVNISSELLKYDSSVSTMAVLLCKPGSYKSKQLPFHMWHKLQFFFLICAVPYVTHKQLKFVCDTNFSCLCGTANIWEE